MASHGKAQFGLIILLLFISGVALFLASLQRQPTAGLVPRCVVLLTLVAAVSGVVYHRGPRQAFWLGVGVVSLPHALNFGWSISADSCGFFFETVREHLPAYDEPFGGLRVAIPEIIRTLLILGLCALAGRVATVVFEKAG